MFHLIDPWPHRGNAVFLLLPLTLVDEDHRLGVRRFGVIADLQVGVYTASKYACNGYTEILRAELAPEDIGVSVLCPGLIDTNLAQTSARNRAAAFGGPMPEPAPMPEAMRATAMAPEDVGPIVVRGIRENRLHILTHPDASLALVRARFEAIEADARAQARAEASS